MAAGTGHYLCVLLMGTVLATRSTQSRGCDVELGWHVWRGAKGKQMKTQRIHQELSRFQGVSDNRGFVIVRTDKVRTEDLNWERLHEEGAQGDHGFRVGEGAGRA